MSDAKSVLGDRDQALWEAIDEGNVDEAELSRDELIERHADVLAVDEADDRLRERVRSLEEENERLQREAVESPDVTASGPAEDDFARAIKHDAVQAALDKAKENGRYDARHFDRVMAVLASAEDGRAAHGRGSCPDDRYLGDFDPGGPQ